MFLSHDSPQVVITGATSKQMSLHAARGIVVMLRRIFPFETFRQKHFFIQNIVCNVKMNLKGIDIEKMYAAMPSLCTFQGSIFPGLVYRPKGCPVVVLIFRSSRVVVTGAKKYDHVVSGFLSIVDTIRPFFVYD
jgi:TATA-box binding protein (TBP) (component of TFIID and TFIIIB)